MIHSKPGRRHRLLLAFLTLAVAFETLRAGTLELSPVAIAGGGSSSGDGISLRIDATVGQPAAGTGLSGGQFSMQIGFWQPLPPGILANVSTRLPVGTDDNVLIQGFIVQGPVGSSKKIMVRAIGPTLAAFGVTDALANPTLEIHDSNNAIIATNNDWRTTQVGGIIMGDQSADIGASGLAPGNDAESAIITNLSPGNYTAIVRGVSNSVGTAVVDAYDSASRRRRDWRTSPHEA